MDIGSSYVIVVVIAAGLIRVGLPLTAALLPPKKTAEPPSSLEHKRKELWWYVATTLTMAAVFVGLVIVFVLSALKSSGGNIIAYVTITFLAAAMTLICFYAGMGKIKSARRDATDKSLRL